MGKKDFSTSTENVFDDFFTQPTEVKKKEVVKEVKEKPVVEKKEVKTTPKKEETKNTEAQKTVKTVKEKIEVEVKEEVKPAQTKVEEKTKELKSHNKDCRFNFYLDVELADFVNNYLWLAKSKTYSQYFNKLVKTDLLKLLNLPADTSNEVLSQKWEEYKKENNL